MTARQGPRLPQPAEFPSIVFRALYSQFELRTIGGLHIAVPKGTPWYAGRSLSEVARQISAAPATSPDCSQSGPPGCSTARST